MRTASEQCLTAESEAEMEEFGERLGRLARPGDFIALTGGLGAGKTVLARGILRGAGVDVFQGSPTFTLIHEYQGHDASGRPLPVYHMDLYRLGPEACKEDLGYDHYFHGDGLAVVEWAELGRGHWPEEYLEVAIERAEGSNERLLRFRAVGDRYHLYIAGLGTGSC